MNLSENINSIINNSINPLLKQHGGSISLVKVDGKQVRVRFLGACSACPSIHETLEAVIYKLLKGELGDNISKVVVANETSGELVDFARNYFKQKKNLQNV
ncbi:MAG: NifU family protein [Prevotella sp.]|jgi:Fe-S cluster biogenesis protein NfuA|nr:NifU family protein [Prevotella sp.]